MDSRDAVVLRDFASLMEAEMTRSLLESSGIRAIIENAISNSVLPFPSTSRVRIVVAREDVEIAEKLLAADWDRATPQE